MKKLLIGLIVLSSLSAFADSRELVSCKVTNVVNDTLLEESLSVEEYPNITIEEDRAYGDFEVRLGASENTPCLDYVSELKREIQSEYKTLNNLARYLDDNSTNWTRIDSALRSLSSSSARRNYRYNGNGKVESRKSKSNASKARRHINKLKMFIDRYTSDLESCLLNDY